MNEKTIRVLELEKITDQLANICISEQAKQRASQLRPATDYDAVATMQAETSEAQQVLLKQEFHIGKIEEIAQFIQRASIGGSLSAAALLAIGDTLRSARYLSSYIAQRINEGDDIPILASYQNSMQTFKQLENEIERCIEDEETLSDDASTTLRQIRNNIDSKNSQIRSRLDKMIGDSRNQKYLQDALVTIRNDRFVLPVKAEYKKQINGMVHDQSASGATLYIEPLAVVNLNNELKQLQLDEQREIGRILDALSQRVAAVETEMSLTYHNLLTLDFIFAKGRLSIRQHAVPAEVNRDDYIRIKEGKHPLLASDDVVPTNFELGRTFRSLLITGPNTGGKTVTLKTVGLFALMTQCGLHIPAAYGSSLPVFQKIFADIGDEQSIEQSLSTFSSHMTNIVDILEHVNQRTLVLFDELGAGTDPTEGAALAMAILKHVYDKNALSVATTHYSELKHFALTSPGFENASVEFDVATLSPTYRLLIGIPGKSNAFEISKKLGLSKNIIASANRYLDTDSIAFEEILQSIERNNARSEEARDKAISLRLDAEKLYQRADRANQKIEAERERILSKAKQEARQLVREAKAEVDGLVKDIREMHQTAALDNKKIESARRRLSARDKALHNEVERKVDASGSVPNTLKLGQEVLITTLGKRGSVIELPDQKGEVQLQVGILKMTAKIKDLRTISQASATKKASKSAQHQDLQVNAMSNQIDLRGQTLDEAMLNLDKYLDDATMAGLETVTVIHGVGSGVLKKGLSDFMRRHPQVKKIRAGNYGEGGAGVSVATLK